MQQPTQLGPYQIRRKLGAGGMGDVFEAFNEQTGQAAAVKVLPEHLGRQTGFRSRFEVEIETLRRLDHPNIVRILGFGQQQDTLFYAMELVRGRSLEEGVQQGRRLPWREVIDIAQQLCKALKHAHDRGIIHRDIKPANIMRLPDGQMKLADFGIAQLYGVSGLTIAGGVVGTASYLSPEQADGQKATPRSDLYSLGATLYALLTGQPPFTGKNLPELLRMQRTAMPPAPGLLAVDVPTELDAVIMGLLAKDPAQRIAAPMMLARSLQAVQDAANLKQAPPEASPEMPPEAPPQESPSDASPLVGVHQSGPDDTQPSGMDATLDAPPTPLPEASEAGGSATVSQGVSSSKTTAGELATLATNIAQPSQARGDVSSGATFMTTQEAAALDRRREQQAEVPPSREIPVGWMALLIGVTVLCVVIYIVLQPPSADDLYDRITAAADQGSHEALLSVASDLDEFQTLYPDDPRQTSLLAIQRRVDQARHVRLSPIARKHFDTGQADLPIARLRDDALHQSATNPQQAIDSLQAIITLYDHDPSLDEPQAAVLQDTRDQLARLQARLQQQRAADLLLLRRKLQQARDLATADPQRAREMATAIVTLFGDKPWASDLVAQAMTLAKEESK